jgi:hypothetical protein
LASCRTAALGGHKQVCDHCGHTEIAYNSCRNRHCPKCRAQARAQWLDDRAGELLPAPYFHLVFTLPDGIGPLALSNRRRVYGILFKAVAETLTTIAGDPRHLGAKIGFLAILHTWGQRLQFHPHLHCVVPGGGLSPERDRWIPCRRPSFFLPVRVLSRLYRGKFLALLRQDYQRGKLHLTGKLAPLKDPRAWLQWLGEFQSQEWVVYAKPPFGGPEQVLKYLARYTHRVAISNRRIDSVEDGKVTFRWKDYAHAHRQRMMTLTAVEFLRRFLLHILPSGFMRIRYYGYLANRSRADQLALARRLLQAAPLAEPSTKQANQATDPWRCPECKVGRLIRIETTATPSERAPPSLAA